jgi:hypothetical protein
MALKSSCAAAAAAADEAALGVVEATAVGVVPGVADEPPFLHANENAARPTDVRSRAKRARRERIEILPEA